MGRAAEQRGDRRRAVERNKSIEGARPTPAQGHRVGQGDDGSLATRELTKSFGGVHAVDGATVSFQHGRINALIGPNGSGKTTFFNCVTGMIRPDSGRISYRGRDISCQAPHRVAARGSAAASSCAGSSRG